MNNNMLSLGNNVTELLVQHLEPRVTSIDLEGVVPSDFLQTLGENGSFLEGQSEVEVTARNLSLIEEVASFCCSTAFMVWCHVTAMSYVRNGQSQYLKQEILPKLAAGRVLGGTGLSNPMKFYAGMESLRLKANRTHDGCRIQGMLPFVSNLGQGHWFGVVAECDESQRVMALIPCDTEGLTLTERTEFVGMNGTGTYNCHFNDVNIPEEYVLADDADELVRRIRPAFVLTQVGMALGLVRACIENMYRLRHKQRGANQYLPYQPSALEERLRALRKEADRLAVNLERVTMQEIFRLRLDCAYLALDATNAGVLHSGGAAYVRSSPAHRRLREAHFIALVTPTVTHLEKVLQDSNACILGSSDSLVQNS
jgi:alkylation response protein AidB-like acyl-CoA dehydrogenase